MKLTKTVLMFVGYSTVTSLFAVSTVQVGVQMAQELSELAVKLQATIRK